MNKLKHYAYFIIAFLFIALGTFSDGMLLQNDHDRLLEKRFERVFHTKLDLLETQLNQITNKLESEAFDRNFQSNFSLLFDLYTEDGIGFLIAEQEEMLFWSGNQFAFNGLLTENPKSKIVYLPNGIYFLERREIGDFQVFGLIHLKNNYPLENDHLLNSFNEDFDLPDDFSIKNQHTSLGLPIQSPTGEYLFSLVPGNIKQEHATSHLWPGIFFSLALLFLLLFVRRVFRFYVREHFIIRISILALALFAFYWFRILFHIPAVCKNSDLFGPSLYAYSYWLPSLGDLLLLAILIFFWAFNFSKDFTLSQKQKNYELGIAFSFILSFYLLINFLIQNLVRNSAFSFQLSRLDNINQFSLIGYIIIVLLFFSAFIMNYKVVEKAERFLNHRLFIVTNTILAIVSLLFSLWLQDTRLYMILLFFLTNLSAYLLQKTQLKKFSLSFIIFFVSLYTFFSLIIVQTNNNLRRQQIQKLMAITLYSEHDPAAEVFLKEMQQRISIDSIIPELLDNNDYSRLEDYITRSYFGGYFRKYDSWVTACDANDSLLIQPDNHMEPCFPFFEQLIEESGASIPGTNFYYMDNMNGRISYFGRFVYPFHDNPLGKSVFIELKSKLLPEGIGFPELLLDKSLQEPNRYKFYSYAKYYKNELVHLSGDYQYNYYFSTYDIGPHRQELIRKSWDGYDHLIYNLDADNYIIVSVKSFGFLEYLISFPYLFVFYFVFILLLVLLGNAKYRRQALVYDLKFRIQASIIAIVLFSLILVASGTIYYNLREYRNKHQFDLNEKMKSIAEEINLRLKDVDEFTPEVLNWLWQDLGELSNVFRTDINIFSFKGELLASSRPEVFNRGIISTRMDAQAYYELSENYQISMMQPEKIGNLSFLSIYEPIINNRGEYLGFINLPYFTRGDELRQEITTFIVAFINLYVLLFFISVIVALLLANQITRPLTLIRERLKDMQLDKKNEPISYNADDEIGALVTEYNRKVEELANSADLLARTQREMAWREMAKQIAHEIKNPLTPMKLHIQHLQRAKQNNSEQYDEIFNRVTRTLIEQIDTLSEIATEFSNFAKMPAAKKEVFNLGERLEHVADLFESNKQHKIELVLPESKVLVFADKEQVSRAVINLIKNGIQSIPSGRKGFIVIRLKTNDTHATLSVSDNGSGISEEVKQHLFQPNFTTKTSGMGLGLAIVKRIVESSNGRIWFETQLNFGTTFYIEFPIHQDFENNEDA